MPGICATPECRFQLVSVVFTKLSVRKQKQRFSQSKMSDLLLTTGWFICQLLPNIFVNFFWQRIVLRCLRQRRIALLLYNRELRPHA